MWSKIRSACYGNQNGYLRGLENGATRYVEHVCRAATKCHPSLSRFRDFLDTLDTAQSSRTATWAANFRLGLDIQIRERTKQVSREMYEQRLSSWTMQTIEFWAHWSSQRNSLCLLLTSPVTYTLFHESIRHSSLQQWHNVWLSISVHRMGRGLTRKLEVLFQQHNDQQIVETCTLKKALFSTEGTTWPHCDNINISSFCLDCRHQNSFQCNSGYLGIF